MLPSGFQRKLTMSFDYLQEVKEILLPQERKASLVGISPHPLGKPSIKKKRIFVNKIHKRGGGSDGIHKTYFFSSKA